ERLDLRRAHFRRARIASADDIGGEMRSAKAERSERRGAGERRGRGRFAAGQERDRTAQSERFEHPAKVHVIGLPTDEKERMKHACSTAGSDGESVTPLVNIRRARLHSAVPRL